MKLELTANSQPARNPRTYLARKLGFALAPLALSLLLGSCGATRPPKYYAISDLANAAAGNSGAYPVTLLVGRITAPHLYRDTRIVYSHDSRVIGAYEDHRWSDPPVDMIQNTLITALRSSGRYRAVQRQSSTSKGDYLLRGHLTSLDEVDSSPMMARFAVELELYRPSTGAVVWSQTYDHSEPVNAKTMPAVVEALERNVRTGMQQLTGSLEQYFASHPAE